MFNIIPDIHGQADKLGGLLADLGWRCTPTGWIHPEPTRQILFLGDFIDRGPENARVLSTVRSLVDDGKAVAIMGNHELNAIHFHTKNPKSGAALRIRDDKNCRQHRTFLEEFPIGHAATTEMIAWMQTLPLYFECDGFRAVHACWNEPTIDGLRSISNSGVLSEEQLVRSADKSDPLYNQVETITKGPELQLPTGISFIDKDGTKRSDVRVRWWNSDATTWADISMSVPKPENLPDTKLPQDVSRIVYPDSAKPVFFGHYWLEGELSIQAPNALCLDYSAGKEGPLISYLMDDIGAPLNLARVSGHRPS